MKLPEFTFFFMIYINEEVATLRNLIVTLVVWTSRKLPTCRVTHTWLPDKNDVLIIIPYKPYSLMENLGSHVFKCLLIIRHGDGKVECKADRSLWRSCCER